MDMVVKTSVAPDGDGSSIIYQESNAILAIQVSGWDRIVKCVVPNLFTEINFFWHAESALHNRLAWHLSLLQEILCAFRVSYESVNIQRFLGGRLNGFSVLWYTDSAVVRFKYSYDTWWFYRAIE